MADGAVLDVVDISVDSVEERYNIGAMLGEGRFSQVFVAARIDSGDEFALKAMEMGTINEDEEALEMLEAEVQALRRAAEHDHLRARVVKLHEVVATPEMLYLAMDKVRGCELFTVIEQKGSLPEPLVRRLMHELVSALAAMHGVGIVHRDIKPENLIVSDYDDPEAAQLVVIDFGYAALLDGNRGLEGLAGSPEYAAPEVLSWLEAEIDTQVCAEPYSAACDVWSCGVTAHVLLCAELHFELPEGTEDDEAALVAAARDSDLKFNQAEWGAAGMDPAKQFIRDCMRISQLDRISASAALDHPWLRASLPPSAAAEPPAAAPPKKSYAQAAGGS